MKNKVLLLAIGLLSVILGNPVTGYSQTASNGKIILTGTRFSYPLIEKWIEEFKKEYPEVPFRLITRGSLNTDSANLIVNAHKLHPEEIKGGNYVVNIGRFALLPVANSKNPLLPEWDKKGLKEKELKKLFFLKYDPFGDEEEVKDKHKNAYKPTLYTRAQKACAPISFARNYGFEQDDILGKPIGGDDKHLLMAIENDTNGITYNNLGFIYDLKTRKVKNKLAVIPLDLNSNGKLDEEETFYNTLDEVIRHLEKEKPSEIAIEHLNISYQSQAVETNKNLSLFVNWVLTKGQQYNHAYGFLEFEPESLTKQIQIFEASLGK
jgi:phosphate transport system substrate-binding protein